MKKTILLLLVMLEMLFVSCMNVGSSKPTTPNELVVTKSSTEKQLFQKSDWNFLNLENIEIVELYMLDEELQVENLTANAKDESKNIKYLLIKNFQNVDFTFFKSMTQLKAIILDNSTLINVTKDSSVVIFNYNNSNIYGENENFITLDSDVTKILLKFYLYGYLNSKDLILSDSELSEDLNYFKEEKVCELLRLVGLRSTVASREDYDYLKKSNYYPVYDIKNGSLVDIGFGFCHKD